MAAAGTEALPMLSVVNADAELSMEGDALLPQGIDVDALSEGDWCLYHRLPDVIQELAFNIVLDRPDDVDAYMRGWLADLKRIMVMNGNAGCAQGVNLTSVNADRGNRLRGELGDALGGVALIEPDVEAQANQNAVKTLASKVGSAQRRATRKKSRAITRGLSEKHQELIDKIAKLKTDELADVTKAVDGVLARRGSRLIPGAGASTTAMPKRQSQHNRMFDDLAADFARNDGLASGALTPAANSDAATPAAAGGGLTLPPHLQDPSSVPAAGIDDPNASTTTMSPPIIAEPPASVPRGGGRRRIAVSAAPVNYEAMTATGEHAVENMEVVPKTDAEKADLRDAMKACTAFNNFDDEDIEQIINVMHREAFPPGEEILMQGQPGRERFYLVNNGTVEVIKSGKVVARMTRGNYFGELELMYSTGTCAATVKSVTSVDTYALKKETYQVLLLRQTMSLRERNLELIERVDFFSDLAAYHKMVLAEAFNTRTYNDGDHLIRRGESGEYLYVVVEGEVVVWGREEGTEKPYEIIRRHAGDVVGEIEFLFNHVAVADVRASGVVKAARLGRRHFESAIGPTVDVLAAQLAKGGYEDYLKHADEKVKKQIAASERKNAKRAVVDPNAQSMARPPSDKASPLLAATVSEVYNPGYLSPKGGNDAGGQHPAGMLMTTQIHPNGEVVFGSGEESGAGGGTLYRFPLDPFQDESVCLVGMQEDGTVLHWSEGMIRTTGYESAEVVGRPIFNLMPQQNDQQLCFELIAAARDWAGDWDGFQDTGNFRREALVFTQASQMSRVTFNATVIPALVEHPVSQVVLLVGHEVRKKPPLRSVDFSSWFLDTFAPLFKSSFKQTNEALNPMKLFEGILPPPAELQQMRELWTQCNHIVEQFEPLAKVDTAALIDNWQPANVATVFRRIQMNLAAETAQRHNHLNVDIDSALTNSEVFVDVKKLPEVISYLVNAANRLHVGVTITVSARAVRAGAVDADEVLGVNKASSKEGAMSSEELVAKHETAKGGAHYIPSAEEKQALAEEAKKKKEVANAVATGQGTATDVIEFTVHDNGAGTADAAADTINRAKSMKGYGLEQAKRGVAAMGGLIFIDTEGAETTARVTVPLVEAQASSGAGDDSSATFTTVLVEADTVQRNFFCQYLWGRKHAVLPATTWRDVLTMLSSSPVDMLIIDPEAVIDENVMLSMDDKSQSPLELLRQYTSKAVVVLTSESFDDETVAAHAADGVLALAKPCSAPRMHMVVDKAEKQVLALREEAEKITELRKTFDTTNRGAWKKGRLLGKGAFGEVYEAIDVLTGGKMAVKIMKNNADNKALMEEIQTMTTLQHENIIHYFYCEENKNETTGAEEILIFMELAAGGVLQDQIKEKHADGMSADTISACIKQILAGLLYVHETAGYVHCDIKSANVLIDASGHYKLGDFGTAKRLASMPEHRLFETRGTPLYMAPEVWNASPGSAETADDGATARCGFNQSADIWSLGCMVMEMATGKSPFHHLGTPVTVMNRISSLHGSDDEPDLSPLFKLDLQIFEFIKACLTVKPEDRPSARALQSFALVAGGADTSAAMRVLQKAELMHHLLRFVAFDSPPPSDDGEADEEFFKRIGKPAGGADAFFDSDDDEEEEEEEDDDDGDDESADGGVVFAQQPAAAAAATSHAAPAEGVVSFTPIAHDSNEASEPMSRSSNNVSGQGQKQVSFMQHGAQSMSGKGSSEQTPQQGGGSLRAIGSMRREVNPFHAPRRRGQVEFSMEAEEVDLNAED